MTGTHILINQDHQAFMKDLKEFCKDRAGAEIHYSTTPVIAGVLANGQANVIVFTSCLIYWECTNEEWESHLFKMKMQLQKV